jgi:hypothetical protein
MMQPAFSSSAAKIPAMPRRAIPKFQLQYDSAPIPELAAAYLASLYRGGTNAEADRAMEDACGRGFRFPIQ